MKNHTLKELSTEDLQKKERSLKVLTYLLAGTLLLSLMFNIIIRRGFDASTAASIALLPIVLANFSTLKEIKKELNSRVGL